MLLLPVSHEDGVVRRLPMVSLGVMAVCLGLQLHDCAVTPDLEARMEGVLDEMARVEGEALAKHWQRSVEHAEAQAEIEAEGAPGDEPDNVLELMARGGGTQALDPALLGLDPQSVQKFRAGELTAPDDPDFLRYVELRDELDALKLQVPVIRFGFRPALDGLGSLFTSLFAHGGWLHLLGNMWFLYLVGCNLEDRWGRWQFALFYLASGLIAALSFGALHRDMQEPLVGASGAIAGAMGAFMICYARTRVKMFYLYFLLMTPRWGTFHASAWVVLLLWVGEQLLMTLVEISSSANQVAYSAHAGGFMFGATVALLLRRTGIDQRLDAASEQAAEAGTEVWTEHPLYLKAMELRDQADDAAATEMLVRLIAEQPGHVGAREALFDLGVAHKDLRAIDLGIPFLIDHYAQKQDPRAMVRALNELRRAVPNYGFSDQELLRLATAAQKADDGPLSIRLVGELLAQWPGSTFEPRALWVAAQVQGRLGAEELQRRTLDRILERFPQHACAELAQQALRRNGAPA